MDCLTADQVVMLIVLGIVAFFLESMWRKLFTPKTEGEHVKELAQSESPRDREIFLEILDEDPSLWAHASSTDDWDLWEDLCGLARKFGNLVGVCFLPVTRLSRLARALRRPQPVPQLVPVEVER